MKILGIETSCDETAASVVEDGRRVLGNVVVSQIDIHAAFGGVVPEVAARSHIEVILPVVEQAVEIASRGRDFAEDISKLIVSPKMSYSVSSSRTVSTSEVLGSLPKTSRQDEPVGDSREYTFLADKSKDSVEENFEDSPSAWGDIDAIAVANRPGLVGSLLIGTLTAKTLAKLKNKPLYPVDHVISHVYANFLGDRTPEFPLLALVVSGGHTQLMLFRSHADYEIIGKTRDDAVGEAFDKVAKVLGLPYPGGPSISQAAERGDPQKYQLPHPKLDNPLDFSFSGLKTAVLRAVQAEVGKDYTFPSNALSGLLNDAQRRDFAASFQQTAVDILVDKLKLAAEKHQAKSICLAGGVSANQLLRDQSQKAFGDIFLPPPEFCTDNAAMVASRGFFQSQSAPSVNPLVVSVSPTSGKS